MTSRSLRFAAVGMCSAALLAACNPAPVEPSVSPTPSASSATPVDPYAEAERVYMRIDWLNSRYVYSGIYQFPDEMHDLAMDPYLSELKQFYTEGPSRDIQLVEPDKATYEVRPHYDDGNHGADIVLKSCADYRQVQIVQGGQPIGFATLRYERWYFKYEAGKLKLFGIKSEEDKSCSLD